MFATDKSANVTCVVVCAYIYTAYKLMYFCSFSTKHRIIFLLFGAIILLRVTFKNL